MLTCSDIRSALAFLLLDLISFFFFLNSCLCPLTLSCFSKLPHWPSFPTGIIILSCSCYPCRHYQPDPAINPLHKGRPKATFTPNPALQQKHTFSFSFLSKEPVFYAVGCCGSQHGWKKYTHTCRWQVESSWNCGHRSLHRPAAAHDVFWRSSAKQQYNDRHNLTSHNHNRTATTKTTTTTSTTVRFRKRSWFGSNYYYYFLIYLFIINN